MEEVIDVNIEGIEGVLDVIRELLTDSIAVIDVNIEGIEGVLDVIRELLTDSIAMEEVTDVNIEGILDVIEGVSDAKLDLDIIELESSVVN